MSIKWRGYRKRKKQVGNSRSSNRHRKTSSHFLTRKLGTNRETYYRRYRHNLLKRPRGKRWGEPEPLVDIIEGKDEVVVVAELAGFKQENLKIHVKDKRLILSAEDSNRKYYRTLNLPKTVIRDPTDTSFKNGVLEIKLRKTLHPETIDKVAN